MERRQFFATVAACVAGLLAGGDAKANDLRPVHRRRWIGCTMYFGTEPTQHNYAWDPVRMIELKKGDVFALDDKLDQPFIAQADAVWCESDRGQVTALPFDGRSWAEYGM